MHFPRHLWIDRECGALVSTATRDVQGGTVTPRLRAAVAVSPNAYLKEGIYLVAVMLGGSGGEIN